MQSQNARISRPKGVSDKNTKPKIKLTYETARWPARTAGRRSENGKIPVNPAKASASRAVCLVFAENHYFAWIYGILSVREGAWFWQKVLHPFAFKSDGSCDYTVNGDKLATLCPQAHRDCR